jgi:CO/xanthine dehydrogenase Mo-binding subunit
MTSYGRMIFLHDTSRSYVSLELDGSATIRAGIQDIGGGQASSLCQIVAEVLGIPVEDIKTYIADTALTPLAGTTTATRQLYMSGNATLMAAGEIRRTLLKKAGEMMELNPDLLDLVNRKVIDTLNPTNALPLNTVIKACASDGLPIYNLALFKAPFRSHAVEVAVDEETGKVEVLKLVSCFDVGRAINRASVEGQIEGGTVYGLGYGLCEEVILEKGITLTPSFSEYLLPTSMDIPNIQTIILESGEGAGPFGARGVGEPSVTAVASALGNAVADAIGVRVYDLPLTPEKVLRALKNRPNNS